MRLPRFVSVLGFGGIGLCLVPGAVGSTRLTLSEAIALALANNQDIKVEAFGPEISRANLVTAYGQFDPVLVLARSYERTDAPASADPILRDQVKTDTYEFSLKGALPWGLSYSLGGNAAHQRGLSNVFADKYATFGGINITQPLLRGFGFGANMVGIRVAKANRSLSEWQYRQTVIETVTNTVIVYSNLVLAYDQLRIARKSHGLVATLMSQNESRLQIGSVGQSDVTTARAEMAAREDAIIQASRAVRNIQIQLCELIGRRTFSAGEVDLLVEDFEASKITVNPPEDLETALAMRPDYQAARLGLTIDKAFSRAAHNGLLPEVNLIASFGYNGLDRDFAASRRMVRDMNYPSSSIGINVTIPITNAQQRGKARAARLQVRQSETALKRLETNVASRLANAADEIDAARQRVMADDAAYEAAKQTLANEEEKLQAGSSTTLAVIQLQQSLINVEKSVASARADQRQAFAEYDRSCGTTLQRYRIELGGPNSWLPR